MSALRKLEELESEAGAALSDPHDALKTSMRAISPNISNLFFKILILYPPIFFEFKKNSCLYAQLFGKSSLKLE